MKIDHVAKVTKCSREGMCDCMQEAILSHNGRKRGLTAYLCFPRDSLVGAEISMVIAYVFNLKPSKGEVGALTILFCPFCGAKYEGGRPV